MNFEDITEQITLVDQITENFDESDLLILRTEFFLTKYEILFTIWLKRQKKIRDKSMKNQLPKVIKDLQFIKSLLEAKKKNLCSFSRKLISE